MDFHGECGRGWSARCANSKGKKCRCKCGGANHGKLAQSLERKDRGDKHARFSIVRSDAGSITIRDEGPWDQFPTITNDADDVVRRMLEENGLGARRLFYYDSDNNLDELRVVNGQFAGFLHVTEVYMGSLGVSRGTVEEFPEPLGAEIEAMFAAADKR